MAVNRLSEQYRDLPQDHAEARDELACRHRERARAALEDENVGVALIEVLLAIESRLDELGCWVARIG